MVLTFDPQDLSSRFSKARIDARSRSAKRWLDPTHIGVVRAELERLPQPTLKPLAELIATAQTLTFDDSSPDEGTATLETAIWPAIDALLDPLRTDLATTWDFAPPAGNAKLDELAEIIRLYELIVPRAAWPSVIVAGNGPQTRPALIEQLTTLRLVRGDDGRRLAVLGLIRVLVPPEPEIIKILATLPTISAMADPAATVGKIVLSASTSDEATDLHAGLSIPSWAPGELGRDVTVVLLDSGIERAHPDLKEIPGDRCRDFTDDGTMTDHFGHGTVTAGLIAGTGDASGGVFRGIAPLCRLYIAKVADGNGAATLGAVIDALDWAVGEANGDIFVVPFSHGGEPGTDPLIRSALAAVAQSGRLVVAAAGDGGPSLDSLAPTAWPAEVLAVGAADSAGNLASFSGRGRADGGDSVPDKPDCLAPGVDLVGPRAKRGRLLREFDDNGDYTILNGSAAAATATAGALALVLSAARETHGGTVKAAQIRRAFLATGRPVMNASPRFEAGHGLPEIRAAIGDVQSRSLPPAAVAIAGDYAQWDRERSASTTTSTSASDSRTVVSPNWRREVSGPSKSDSTELDLRPVSGHRSRQAMADYDARDLDLHLIAMSDQAAEKARERLMLAEIGESDASSAAARLPSSASSASASASAEARMPAVDPPSSPPKTEQVSTGVGQAQDIMSIEGSSDTRKVPALKGDEGGPDEFRKRDEPITQIDFDAQQSGTVDTDLARKLEQEFINGFEARFYTLSTVPNPLEGNRRYEIQAAGETTTFFSDRDELKKLLIRSGTNHGDLRAFPLNKGVEVALVRKKLFGPREKKLAFVGACISPLDELVSTGRGSRKANRRDLVRLIDRCVTDEKCFYYLGFFSTTRWTEDAKDATPRGKNFQVFLLECEEDVGFRVYAPSDLDPVVRQAFDPEDEVTKLDRARRRLRRERQLQIPGGFLLIKEVAENANVPEALALRAAEEMAREEKEIRIEKVDNTLIVRHKRF